MRKHAAVWVYDSLGHGERQQKECEEVARGFGYETVAAFVSSGAGRNEAWANLVSFVKSGGADLVVAYSPSRIGACHEEFEERKNFLESARRYASFDMSRIEESPPANSWQKPGDAPSDQKGFVSQKGRSYSTMSSMLRAAIYARFSSDKQRDASIEDQVAAGNRYAAMRGYEVVAVYADYAISGRSDDRPQFLQ